METATQKNSQVRTETLRRIQQTLNSLFEATGRLGGPVAATRVAMRSALSARCVQCLNGVTGGELYLLAQPGIADEGNRLRRLRHGVCAKEGCECTYYQVIYHAHPDVDWDKLFSLLKTVEIEAAAETAKPEPEIIAAVPIKPKWTPPSRRTVVRISAVAGALLAVFIFRQVYYGGTIPLVRQPEKFHVDVAPPQNSELARHFHSSSNIVAGVAK